MCKKFYEFGLTIYLKKIYKKGFFCSETLPHPLNFFFNKPFENLFNLPKFPVLFPRMSHYVVLEADN